MKCDSFYLTQDAWWKEILCDKGMWMYTIIWCSCNERVTLPFNDIDVHYLHGKTIEWSHYSCMFSSLACQTLYHTAFFLERREGQESLALPRDYMFSRRPCQRLIELHYLNMYCMSSLCWCIWIFFCIFSHLKYALYKYFLI